MALKLFASLLVAVAMVFAGCSEEGDRTDELLVFAAASLADALEEIEARFEAASETRLAFSYGGSQALAQQIARGAPADVLVSAGRSPVDFLAERDMVELLEEAIVVNRLVVAVRRGAGPELRAMEELSAPSVERIAVADPALAPAGHYARESLEGLGLWDALSPKLVFGSDVRATLAYLQSGNVDAALVYASDAAAARNIDALDIVPHDSYSRIVYPALVVRGSDDMEAAREFVAFLRSVEAREVFVKHGLQPAD